MSGYPTPEEAARSTAPDDWPPGAPIVQEWAFVVGSSIAPDGVRALVILGEDREVGAYWGQESWCQRADGGWHVNEWCRYGGAPLVGKPLFIDPEPSLGPVALVLQAPAGATRATVRYDGREHAVRVTAEGWVFFAAWGHPYAEDQPATDWYSHLKPAPRLVGFE